ncbi:hypothetical protein [Deinococcus xianganensis]|uniref:Uncharacterized protein n=1 Tax=Deinococcus xianganensis TaxID=1507289 RepID=A0A6I4YNW7_9DEIO|nr:hypothetical protein [Deinococcus xianganensis]MXV21791.1 hypothetical protein [Deinococcus xianganensis]
MIKTDNRNGFWPSLLHFLGFSTDTRREALDIQRAGKWGGGRVRRLILLAALLCPAASAAAPAVKTSTLTDSRLVLATLKGNVQLYGTRFGDQAFQAGVLALLRARKIQVTVLTSQAAVKSMAPLKAAGAKVFYLPTGVNMTGSLVLSGNDTVLMNKDGRTWYVMQGPGLAVQAKTQMTTYAPYAKAY